MSGKSACGYLRSGGK